VAIIGGAFLVGAATLVGAGIVATAVIAAAVMLDDDEEPSRPTEVPGTPPSQRRMGEQDLPASVRGFIDREMLVSATSSGEPVGSDDQSRDSDRAASAGLTYSLDGDVRDAPVTATRFEIRDLVTLRLTFDAQAASAAPVLTFAVDTLVLSTIDAPGIDGHVTVEFVASQDHQELWRWSGHIAQGKKPRLSTPEGGTQRITRQSKDLLIVRNVKIPLKYAVPSKGETAVIEVAISVEGVGARVGVKS
jgi:hypothetical protein